MPTIQVSSRGNLIRAEKKNLHHVNQNDGDHEVGTPAMESTDVPAERDGMIQRLQAVPGFAGGRNVDEGEQDAGDDLQDEDDERGAAENVKPAGGFARHRMLGGFANGGGRVAAARRTIRRFSGSGAWKFPAYVESRRWDFREWAVRRL